jgi:hypothetical protein
VRDRWQQWLPTISSTTMARATECFRAARASAGSQARAKIVMENLGYRDVTWVTDRSSPGVLFSKERPFGELRSAPTS